MAPEIAPVGHGNPQIVYFSSEAVNHESCLSGILHETKDKCVKVQGLRNDFALSPVDAVVTHANQQ